MLTAVRLADGRKVLANTSQRWQAPFACGCCGEEAVLAKGPIVVHHFRHKPEFKECAQERGESPAHRDCKMAIYEALRSCSAAADVELEKKLGANIADVFAMIRGQPVAIEVQRSRLDIETITARTQSYHRQGCFVLWLGLLTDAHCFNEYAPANWERWCHALYGGRVYYWVSEDVVQPVHFEGCKLNVPAVSWPAASGREYSAGGYSKFSKRLRNPLHGTRVQIRDGFSGRVRQAWSGGTVDIPRCSLFVDKQRPWWSMEGRSTATGSPDESLQANP